MNGDFHENEIENDEDTIKRSLDDIFHLYRSLKLRTNNTILKLKETIKSLSAEISQKQVHHQVICCPKCGFNLEHSQKNNNEKVKKVVSDRVIVPETCQFSEDELDSNKGKPTTVVPETLEMGGLLDNVDCDADDVQTSGRFRKLTNSQSKMSLSKNNKIGVAGQSAVTPKMVGNVIKSCDSPFSPSVLSKNDCDKDNIADKGKNESVTSKDTATEQQNDEKSDSEFEIPSSPIWHSTQKHAHNDTQASQVYASRVKAPPINIIDRLFTDSDESDEEIHLSQMKSKNHSSNKENVPATNKNDLSIRNDAASTDDVKKLGTSVIENKLTNAEAVKIANTSSSSLTAKITPSKGKNLRQTRINLNKLVPEVKKTSIHKMEGYNGGALNSSSSSGNNGNERKNVEQTNKNLLDAEQVLTNDDFNCSPPRKKAKKDKKEKKEKRDKKKRKEKRRRSKRDSVSLTPKLDESFSTNDEVTTPEQNDLDDSFDIIPKAKPLKNYVYKETIRKQADRRKLPSFGCVDCVKWFDALGLSAEERERRLKQTCKHKYVQEPQSTPDHLWSIRFPDTQECIDRGYIQKE